jgi:hypothetical protein
VIYIDLITAKLAREKQQNKKVEKIISLVREYVCDDKAEYVCCPKYMGQFINNITNMVNTVYAINRDTVMVRSNIEEKRWINTEALFWRDESCFPWLGKICYCHPTFHTIHSDYKSDLDLDTDLNSNDVDGDDENLEETRILLPGTLTVEDIRYSFHKLCTVPAQFRALWV